jgi:hypothetical protein
MQRFQGGGTANESRWGVKPISNVTNSAIPLAPVQDPFPNCATVDGDTPVPVEYAVLDIALGSPRVGDYEVKIPVFPNAHRLPVRTFPRLTVGGASELLRVDQRDMLIGEFDEFASCVRGDGDRKASAAEGTAAPTVVPAVLESDTSESALRLR